MRITILTQGTRGDVQPCIALGVGLRKAGHQVTIASHQLFEDFISENGLDFTDIGGDPSQWHQKKQWKKGDGKGFNWIKADRDRLLETANQQLDKLWKACQDADVILWTNLFMICHQMAEALNIPSFGINPYPTSPTNNFACPWSFGRYLDGFRLYNWLTWMISFQVYWQLLRKVVNQWFQKNLQKPGFSWRGAYHDIVIEKQTPVIFGFSPSLLPKPTDWQDWLHVTGYWFLDTPKSYKLPQDLVNFLEKGESPIYIGFGSVANDQPEVTTNIILQALKLTGYRGILDLGWGGINKASIDNDQIFWIDKTYNILHEQLFPHLKGLVHHGGSGTTTVGIKSGIPTTIIPTFGDQFLWARQISNLGLGTPPIFKSNLNVDTLASALDILVKNKTITNKTQEFSQKLKAEYGVTKAIKIFHQYLENWKK